ncbi:Pr6Pr family membrane protein [Lacisediminihabitans sp. H27-G8]|uniref:Pr6Pr family membrane protein n=1 Tax=Lacisediminihabitans sp. H27-G8 TaxID=3111909 RepID=UPI0038FC5DEE
MKLRATFGALRLLMAAVCLVALVSRFLWGLGSATFTPGNFFAYLTIQSSMLFLVVTIIAAVVSLRGQDDAPWLDLARATVLSCTVSCGIIFALIIEQSGERGFRIDVPWSDVVLHFVLPAVAVLDWIIGPGRGIAPWRSIAIVLVFMLGWGLVTLARGPIVGWYPYFFLDPAQLANVAQFFYFGSIAVLLFGGISTALVAVSRTMPLGERWTARWEARAALTPPRTERGTPERIPEGRRR